MAAKINFEGEAYLRVKRKEELQEKPFKRLKFCTSNLPTITFVYEVVHSCEFFFFFKLLDDLRCDRSNCAER